MRETTMSNDVYEIFLRFNNEWKCETDEEKKDRLFCNLVNLYNDWCEHSVRQGEGYLFDITKDDNICCCIQGGTDIQEIDLIKGEYHKFNTSPFFAIIDDSFGRKDKKLKLFQNKNEVIKFIYERRDDIFEWLVTNPECEYFSYFYDNFILPTILNKPIFWNE